MARSGTVQAPLGAWVPSSAPAASATTVTSRHSALVRITHWITTLCFVALLVSGGEIVISHPRFYWGETGNVLTTPLFKLPIPSSRALVPTGYGYVLPDQNGWSRYLHFQAAWVVVVTGLLYLLAGLFTGHLRKSLLPTKDHLSWRVFSTAISDHLRFKRPSEAEAWSYNVLQRLAYLFVIFVLFPLVIWTRSGDVSRFCFGVSGNCHFVGRAAIRAHDSLLRLPVFAALPACACCDGLSCRVQEPNAGDDHGPGRYAYGAHMSDLSRRKLITAGLATAAGVSGLAVAARIAEKYGLVPPDHGGIFGLGETLTYASQRLLTRHSLAREFSRSQITKPPFPNEVAPPSEAFKRLQAGRFVDWRLVRQWPGRPARFIFAGPA